ncbi:putative hemolysin [Moraxella nasicaprae]|uniref:DUF333 domain-containing protein n=1 Tax=Moraxella nasicaprae TaxID=2904122 RepID=A0ABY6F5K0_9GAMM|nr:DUF333 domain-containing protein [Moraxella nasicaprae]UXZ05380.1 DUF333 domain-containing protein [Moraxella nasicaprae]
MKNLLLLGVMMSVLTACQSTPNQITDALNPASEFCVKQGGQSQIRKNADGSEYGVCVLPNGQVVEEWEYFRLMKGMYNAF